ncbi:uncharacterized protein [Pleurodeles waltl]|uniref:uncharacterized protein isoform X2 n=1 Tax=Pleurodeles waltl TaxID=8319 RepID=UPI003709AAD6
MPISSGAEGHVGVGVDTSIKWIPDGGTDFQTPRDVNSYLQRYLDSFPKARKRNIEGRLQDGANHHEALLETEDSQLVINNQNTTKDGKTPKQKNPQDDGAGSPRISDGKIQKRKNQQQEHQGNRIESGTDSKTPKRKNEQHQDLGSQRKSDVKIQKVKNNQQNDLTSTGKSEHEAFQGNNEQAQNREEQDSSPNPADSTSAAKDGGSTKGKGSKTGAKSSTCTLL